MEDLTNLKKRARNELDQNLDTDSPEVKRLRENLLDFDDDDGAEFCTTSYDLDSFIKSFEEEITASPTAAVSDGGEVAPVVDLTSDSGESRPDLGYLLEASDDELGLPPTAGDVAGGTGTELIRVESDSSELGNEFWEIPSYDSFGDGFGDAETSYGNGSVEYVALDGLFDYSDVAFGSGDFAWRPEILPAQ